MTVEVQFFKKRCLFFFLFFVLFFSLTAECEVAVHPCKVLLVCPAEASHVPILNTSTAIIALVYPAPDGVLCLVGKVLGAVVTRLVATIASAARLRHAAPHVILGLVGEAAGDAAVAGGARTLSILVACAAVVALLLAVGADVRQNDRNHLALGAPAVSSGRGVARVVAARVALMAIVGPEDGGPHIPAVRAAAPVLAAFVAGRAELVCHIGTVGLVAEVDVRIREGHLVVKRTVCMRVEVVITMLGLV